MEAHRRGGGARMTSEKKKQKKVENTHSDPDSSAPRVGKKSKYALLSHIWLVFVGDFPWAASYFLVLWQSFAGNTFCGRFESFRRLFVSSSFIVYISTQLTRPCVIFIIDSLSLTNPGSNFRCVSVVHRVDPEENKVRSPQSSDRSNFIRYVPPIFYMLNPSVNSKVVADMYFSRYLMTRVTRSFSVFECALCTEDALPVELMSCVCVL